ncbi:MAG TPA: TlpA disulfide reductase family protein [Tahibacter sp.]|uniref:TlpA family protein disulfide reductase n=1 Tax=Tahibacter sp. TaxID=2056211 RepID=UPI002C541836|nr:TlpA disulfide reductase family protein [Tahibacter sp.]HSX61330.1 TlpA disulfide reductase family protein [Tahibacter sp.]
MGWKQTAAIGVLALAAGVAGLVVGSIVTGKGAPRGITDLLSRSETTRWLAEAWIEAARPQAPAGVTVARKGDPAPAVALLDRDGKSATLAQWPDRLVVVNFWATWCGPCRKEMPELDRFQRKHAANGVQVVGVALDGLGDVEAFLRDTPVEYPILLSPNLAANPSLPFGNTYGALPYSVLLGRDGRILDTRLGEVSEAVLEGWIAPHR